MNPRTVFRALAASSLALVWAVSSATAGEDSSSPTVETPPPLVAEQDFHLLDDQLAALVEELLLENPEVRQARARSSSSRERISQARSLPDPQLTYKLFLSTPETRVGPQRQGAEISQALPWAGKRKFQAERAGYAANEVAWSARGLERSLVAELKKSYFDVAYLQEALAINRDEASLLRRFEQIALTRYSTGEGFQQSVIKVQTDLTRLADQEISLRRRLDSAERRVAELLGRPEGWLVLEPIALTHPELIFDREALESEAIGGNPAVVAGLQRVEADRVWARRRHRDSYPDFSVGLGYYDVGRRDDPAGLANPPQDNGKDIWSLSVKLNIPLQRGRVKAGIAEAEQSLLANRHAVERERDHLRHGVQESLLRLESCEERARLYRDLLIPQAEESLASAEAAYSTNRLGFLDLLDAERVLFEIRRTYHRLVSDYWISLADVERTIGRAFPGPLGEEGTS